eukprot:scaffold298051_cov36-Prasinocladus_malaysianus.AAC.1
MSCAVRFAMCTSQVTRAVKTKLVALTVLHRKAKFVDHLHEGGLIENTDYESIQTLFVNIHIGTVMQHRACVIVALSLLG